MKTTILKTPEDSSNAGAFRVETRGIDFVPEHHRWATPRNIGAMWAGSSINVEYFVYGALLMGFGFSFWNALILIVVGNLSFLLLGLASLQGPETGTTAFIISRAAFGTRGSRIAAFFNWITMLGFETEGLILIVGAILVVARYGHFHVSNLSEILIIVLATAVQAVIPYLGHATIVKVLRALIIPFAIIFAIFAFFISRHASTTHVIVFAHGWESFSAGLAFVIALSGLGWAECGNDYSRYLPRSASKTAIVAWIFLGTAIPEILMMSLGALGFTFLSNASTWNSANPFDALYHQSSLPAWFVIAFLLFAVVQLFAVNSLDLYSSGVSLQAMGLHLRRYQAVLLDSVIVCALTIYASFASTFSLYMKDFVGIIIVWISPWFAIFIVDWLLRRGRYNATELQRDDPEGLYWGHRGFNWNAVIAFISGLVAATISYAKAPPPVNFPPHWMTAFSNHFGGFWCTGATDPSGCGIVGWFSGADLSFFFGVTTSALLYYVLEKSSNYVAQQVARQ